MEDARDSALVREMLDQFEIEKLLKRYASALDLRQYERLDACFTPDAWIDYVAAGGIAGRYPEIMRGLRAVLAPIVVMHHFISTVELELDGDRASGRTYTLNVNGIRDAQGELRHMVVGAIYVDRFERRPEGWRIAERTERRLCTLGHVFGPES
jgi:3-phenylpropionate/cinnamic acid dioxygenase small subunit